MAKLQKHPTGTASLFMATVIIAGAYNKGDNPLRLGQYRARQFRPKSDGSSARSTKLLFVVCHLIRQPRSMALKSGVAER